MVISQVKLFQGDDEAMIQAQINQWLDSFRYVDQKFKASCTAISINDGSKFSIMTTLVMIGPKPC